MEDPVIELTPATRALLVITRHNIYFPSRGFVNVLNSLTKEGVLDKKGLETYILDNYGKPVLDNYKEIKVTVKNVLKYVDILHGSCDNEQKKIVDILLNRNPNSILEVFALSTYTVNLAFELIGGDNFYNKQLHDDFIQAKSVITDNSLSWNNKADRLKLFTNHKQYADFVKVLSKSK
jgi:hypothetical protein